VEVGNKHTVPTGLVMNDRFPNTIIYIASSNKKGGGHGVFGNRYGGLYGWVGACGGGVVCWMGQVRGRLARRGGYASSMFAGAGNARGRFGDIEPFTRGKVWCDSKLRCS
jgi:hypothetical protein